MKTERLHLRISPATKRLLARAAKQQKQTLTAFVETSAIDAASGLKKPSALELAGSGGMK